MGPAVVERPHQTAYDHWLPMEDLLPLVYGELKRIAARQLRGERSGHTLCTTALVHEAWVELAKLDRIRWQNRSHYLALAAQAMRRVLIDHAVAKRALKRGGGQPIEPLEDDAVAMVEARAAELLDLDAALVRLAALDPRQAKIVECRFFGGMSIEETAEALDTSPATVKRQWVLARAWLNRELGS
jgi:RNA polymerase sigma-70 factor, ECF subfamily